MKKTPKVQNAKLIWEDEKTLRSEIFDDVYFSSVDGLHESKYAFIDGIGGSDYWRDYDSLTIAETGFGTGLNFLNLWHEWQKSSTPNQRLHFMSVEAYPLQARDIKKALSIWPDLTPYLEKLLTAYPEIHPGIHRLSFDQGRVILTLLFGDATQMLSQVQGYVDAWFLDGFSPAKNETMWNKDAYQQIARLSKPKAKIATFTAAGHVRRGLESVGFTIKKRKGFGIKRECIQGEFIENAAEKTFSPYANSPWFSPTPPIASKSRIAIIGGGIAGITLCETLLQRGYLPTVLEAANEAGHIGSGNHVGLIQPRLTAADSLDGQFNASAFMHAIRHYDCVKAWLEKRGVLQLARDDAEDQRFQKLIKEQRLPSNIMEYVGAARASKIANIKIKTSALYFPTGGCINPKEYVQNKAKSLQEAGTFFNNSFIQELSKSKSGWILSGTQNQQPFTSGPYDAVILANGPFANQTWSDWEVPLHAKRGQVSHLSATTKSNKLSCALAFDGYISPAYDIGGENIHVAGASYANFPQNPELEKEDEIADWRSLRPEDENVILDNLNIHLSELQLQETSKSLKTDAGRAGLRATVPDHLAIIGAIPNHDFFESHYGDLHHGKHISRYNKAKFVEGLYCFTGLGSRGVQTSPLLAEVLADLLTGEPCALPIDQLKALHPARFHIRRLKRPPHLRD